MSLSVSTVLYENESHYVHLITSQYECVVNCLWTAQCLRVIVSLVLFAYDSISLAAWELNFRGLSHLKWKKIPEDDPRTIRPHLSTTPKEGGWNATEDQSEDWLGWWIISHNRKKTQFAPSKCAPHLGFRVKTKLQMPCMHARKHTHAQAHTHTPSLCGFLSLSLSLSLSLFLSLFVSLSLTRMHTLSFSPFWGWPIFNFWSWLQCTWKQKKKKRKLTCDWPLRCPKWCDSSACWPGDQCVGKDSFEGQSSSAWRNPLAAPVIYRQEQQTRRWI